VSSRRTNVQNASLVSCGAGTHLRYPADKITPPESYFIQSTLAKAH